MRVIDYRRHCALLCVAALVFVFSLRLPYVSWLPRSAFFFGLIGALHALAVVGSLKTAASLPRRCVFVFLAALISVVGPLAAFWLAGLATDLLGDATFWLALAFASVIGASTYWLLVRWSFIETLGYKSLGFTIGLCGLITPIAYLSASALTGFGQHTEGVPALLSEVLPTVGWWSAFSYSLNRGESFGSDSGNAVRIHRSGVRA